MSCASFYTHLPKIQPAIFGMFGNLAPLVSHSLPQSLKHFHQMNVNVLINTFVLVIVYLTLLAIFVLTLGVNVLFYHVTAATCHTYYLYIPVNRALLQREHALGVFSTYK